MANLSPVQEKLAKAGQARPGGPAAADHGGDHAAQGKDEAAGDRRAVRRDQGAAARLLRRSSATVLDEALGIARELADANPERRLLRDPPGRHAQSHGPATNDRHAWINQRLTAARPQAVGGAAALFPRSRHGRGGLPGRVPARAEDLAAERPAARSGRLADLRRPQHRHRRRAPQVQAAAAARRADAFRSRRRRNDAGRAARRGRLPRRHLAAAVHLLPSGPAGDAADRAGAAHRLGPVGQADRARLPGRRKRHGAAHHARQGADRAGRRAVRDAGRGRALGAASPRSRPWSI